MSGNDFASPLERAIERSGKAREVKQIEAAPRDVTRQYSEGARRRSAKATAPCSKRTCGSEVAVTSLYASLEKRRPYILSVLRIVVALLFLEHGLQKYFGFPSAGPPTT